MSLLDDIEAEVVTPGSKCSVGTVLAALDPTDAEDLRAAIAGSVPASAISKALRKRGVDLNDSTIARHRRGRCKCP